ncbi:uncharacterized protein LOC117121883 [Anneissia japonica]|uniref:uncharacterized protein LOC117121883 n=1 Tax=Anneissia japonica TaxID=1529436 RepID=UPI001425B6BF|nr:uncharacterized protein LOC117121883 [Anneissia japonica]
MTNLQSILFWIRSIFEHAVLLHGSEAKNVINRMIASPTISLIGTHKDLLQGSDAEKQAKIDDIFDRILKAIEGEPYERHVDRERYAVDNTTALDEGIQRLKRNVGGFMKAMARTVPIKWVEFQIKVLEIGKTTLGMSLDEITKIADQCGINEDKVIHVLNYLNDIGVILYSATNKKLKNTVITKIHALIKIFMKIITVVEPDDVDKYPVMIKDWRKFSNEGILTKPLAEHLWTSGLTVSKSDGDVDKIVDCSIELMKMFGLLFEKNKSDDSTRQFVVPSRMKANPNDRLEIKKDDKQTVSIYVTPKDFLPDAVYDVLVVRFVSLSQDRGFREDPKLFQNQAEIKFSDTHYLKLGRISIDNKPSLIKLEISKMKVKKAEGAYKQVCKPDPDVCIKVLDFLKQYLDEVYPSKKILGYALQILCLVCSDDCMEKPHFQDLEICLKGDNMTCDRKGEFIGSETTEIQKFFVAEKKRKIPPSDEFTTKKLKTGEQTAIEELSAKEFKVLKAVFSQGYDSDDSLNMLKVLFRDKMDINELSLATNVMDLLNNLIKRNHLSLQNIGLLCDVISVTKHWYLPTKIKEKVPKFPDVMKGTISTEFTSHRQKLMNFGMSLSKADVTKIDGLYNEPYKKDYTDSWSMISDLEKRLIISEENMEEFADMMKNLGLTLV